MRGCIVPISAPSTVTAGEPVTRRNAGGGPDAWGSCQSCNRRKVSQYRPRVAVIRVRTRDAKKRSSSWIYSPLYGDLFGARFWRDLKVAFWTRGVFESRFLALIPMLWRLFEMAPFWGDLLVPVPSESLS